MCRISDLIDEQYAKKFLEIHQKSRFGVRKSVVIQLTICRIPSNYLEKYNTESRIFLAHIFQIKRHKPQLSHILQIPYTFANPSQK